MLVPAEAVWEKQHSGREINDTNYAIKGAVRLAEYTRGRASGAESMTYFVVSASLYFSMRQMHKL